MMTPEECAQVWKKIVQIYNETRTISPETTMNEIVNTFGINKTKEVFAIIAAIKRYDGRIYGSNREFMKGISFNPEAAKWKDGNPMIYAGVDDIHTSHINQLITELRRIENEK